MTSGQGQMTTVEKEMGLTHKDFFSVLPDLLAGIPYEQCDDTIRFRLHDKQVEIMLAPEGVREVGRSFRLPVTLVTLRFYGFTDKERNDFVRRFNMKYMKGGG